MIARNLFVFLMGFLVAGFLSPLVLSLSKKLKARQTILQYVKEHEAKNGTPTMGGIIFIVACSLVCLCFLWQDFTLGIITIAVMIAYGFLGFLDDFLKVHFKHNLGLKAYQKIIGQVGIAIIIAIFVYNSNLVGTSIYVPFTKISIDIGFWIIPLIVFIYLAVVNSVNLLDGLDGLCSGVTFVYILSFACVMLIYSNLPNVDYYNWQNLIQICFAMSGCLLAYFILNCYPAKIFMGDTGSLALGGLVATLAIFTGLELYIPILGIPYVVTALSDIIQVLYYKRTKRRVFLMAPLHHHFQKKGVNESKIVTIYIISTMVVCLVTLTLILYFGGIV